VTERVKSVRGADREQVRDLFVRTTKHRVERAVPKVAEEEQSSLELFRKPATVVSKNDRLVDYQCEKKETRMARVAKLISESAKEKRLL
jgi:hypothetical protein